MKAAYRHWHRENQPDSSGYWYCRYCGVAITVDKDNLVMGVLPLTVDHYYSRSLRPDLKYDPKNLVACCPPCNTEKGSLSGDEYIKLRKRREHDVQT